MNSFGIDVSKSIARRTIAFLVGGAVIAGLIGQLRELPVLSRYFLPLLSEADGTAGLLSLQHLFDVVNLLLLSALPAVVMLPLSMYSRSHDNKEDGRDATIALSLVLPSLAFLIFFTPELGAAKDWDLFSIAAWLLLPGALLLYRGRYPSRLGPELLPLVGIGLTVALSFAVVNHSPVLSAERYVQLLKQYFGKNHFIEFANLSRLSENYPELRDMSYKFALEAWDSPPRNLSDSTYAATRLTQMAIARNDRQDAAKFLSVLRALDTLDINTYKLYQAYIERFSTPDKLTDLAAEVDKRFPNDALGQMQAGIMYMKANLPSLGGLHLEKAWQLDSTLYFVQLNWGNYLLSDRKYEAAAHVLKTAVSSKPDNFAARANLALAAALAGNQSLAREQLPVLNRLATTQTHRQRIDQILNLLGD